MYGETGVQCSLFIIQSAKLRMTTGHSNPSLIGNYPPFTDFLCFLAEDTLILASKFDAMQITIVNGNPEGRRAFAKLPLCQRRFIKRASINK
jgi:hypothetical protein